MKLIKLMPNLYKLLTPKNVVFFSFETPIIVVDTGTEVLWVVKTKYSKTTSEHKNIVKKMYDDYDVIEIDELVF